MTVIDTDGFRSARAAVSAETGLAVAVLIPCYNEAAAIAQVVADFRTALPEARIYVYDNNSTDGTAAIARAAGAEVRREPRQGKGHVVRRMFADVDADIYVMVDGDGTYDAAAAPAMVQAMTDNGLDLVNGVRVASSDTAYRPGHAFGNRMLSGLVRTIFGRGSSDMLSGYRVFSRRFVKTFPMMARGFEIETELTVHSLELGMPMDEVPGRFTDRAAGSESKLNSVRDGLRILSTILRLLKQERPMALFGTMGAVGAALSLGLGMPVVAEYLSTGLVPRLPTALLAASLMLMACLGFTAGLILETVTRGRQEMKRMTYLSVPGVLARLEGRAPAPARAVRAG
ncbi:putative glycosyl transferase, family 2 [Roseivivax marinus]|uniref:Putative glycosyl transferase, family 2 n=1 Tax=Roseivivax marinus TaxID=1379903 RepID=W4HD59_9RHOB|nr:glycosyltransferase [Roseivivax marinus]ETW10674.1 putative glycosyl transferase, family 2 [Roseivivax marinus]UMA66984.1 glycosyltransferase [Roseivivax marinus]